MNTSIPWRRFIPRSGSFVALFSVLLAASSARAAVLRVPADYPTLHSAVQVAVAGDSILVSPGVYAESGLALGSRITVLGSPEDPSAVVVDGSMEGRVLSVGQSACVRGLTFRHGRIDGYEGGGGLQLGLDSIVTDCVFDSCFAVHGGGLYGDRVSVQRCRFHSCGAFASGSLGALGGGVYLADAAMEDCLFETCTSENGGGGAYAYDVTVTRCDFHANRAHASAGLHGSEGTTVTRCSFRENVASVSWGGGATGGDIEDCEFLNNTSAYAGGAVAFAKLHRCLVRENHSLRGGGAAFCSGLKECRFIRNTADVVGGAVYAPPDFPVVLTGCLFLENQSSAGGGIYAQSVDVSVDQCTFVANRATNGGSALALVPAATTMSIANSILALSPVGVPVTYWTLPGVPPLRVQCTDVFGNADGDWVGALAALANVNHNFSADPRFCDLATGDFTLTEGSPCLAPWSPCSAQVGAFGEGCGVVALEAQSWGRLKSLFR